MGKIKYLIPFWIAVVVYTLFSIFTGARGVSAYNQLKIERDKQVENMEALQLINKELENTKNALLYDEDALAVYARELGYGSANERFIRIAGLDGTRKQRTEAGQILIASKPNYISDESIKIFSFCLGFGLFICMLVFDRLQHGRHKGPRTQSTKKTRFS
ncbi:MAG: septum formation initiator family protein [Treponema sp.]|jgi:cell division protein FtsB|nr:septum formation initiator family protein [Treponema sp.]